ncbi:MAG: hypothetical protein ABI432_11810 [Flavobacteriales bacterium]
MKIKTTLSLFVSALLLSSCAKDGEDGATGPQGNANVQTTTFSVSPGDWAPFGTSGQVGYGYGVNWNTSIVTDAIANNGAVLLYLKSGTDRWVALPVTIPEGSTWNKTWLYSFGPQSVQIEVYDDDQLTVAPNQVHEFKIVAIANSGMILDGGVDVNNYEAVSRYFDLEH